MLLKVIRETLFLIMEIGVAVQFYICHTAFLAVKFFFSMSQKIADLFQIDLGLVQKLPVVNPLINQTACNFFIITKQSTLSSRKRNTILQSTTSQQKMVTFWQDGAYIEK